MKSILIPAVFIAMFAFTLTDELTGRWESKPSAKGTVTGVLFKSDKTFEGYINRKPFVSGEYELENGIFSFVDNGCDGKKGTYKIVFFSDGDSLKFEPVVDSCVDRKNGMSRLVLGRVKI
jgi:hypothetical protein